MPRPPLSRCIIHALIVLVSFYSVSMIGQSPAAPSPASQNATKKTSPPTLEVVRAEYFARQTDAAAGTDATALPDLNKQVDTVRYALKNDGQKAVTAYEIEISYTSDGKPVGFPSGIGADLMYPIVNAQCQPSDAGSETSSQGAIGPGDTYTDSTVANLDKEKLNGQIPSVHVSVTGIIWSDGTVEGEGMHLQSMNRILRRRRNDAEDGAKVIAILDAHQDDPDIHHRIGEVAKAIQVLMDEVPAVQKTAEGTTYGNGASAALTEPLNNLRIFESTPYAKEAFEAYSASYECRYKHLAALLGPAGSLKAEK
jgi:hypothetical protein